MLNLSVSVWWIPIGILVAAFIGCIVLVLSDEGDGGTFISLPGERFFLGCFGMIASLVLCVVVLALWGWLR